MGCSGDRLQPFNVLLANWTNNGIRGARRVLEFLAPGGKALEGHPYIDQIKPVLLGSPYRLRIIRPRQKIEALNFIPFAPFLNLQSQLIAELVASHPANPALEEFAIPRKQVARSRSGGIH